ncbi:MAG: acetyl-CoA decarbonylase/synthase complex subunit gamma [Planctomycetota bacterium]|jgi:acetyl-CoA decarbonylase/synthase complex subunit gamma
MALTGLQIYKLLPKTNCKKCGFPTCLAFAMALAQKKVELAKCPDVSEEAKTELEGASAPPIRLVTIGAKENPFEIGNETVLFRHEQTFFHPCGLAVKVDSGDADRKAKFEKIRDLQFVRVGQDVSVELVALEDTSPDAAAFAEAAKEAREITGRLLILMTEDPAKMKAAAEALKADRPLLFGATAANAEEMAAVAKDCGCPLGVKAANLDEAADLTQKIKNAGVEDMVIDPGSRNPRDALKDFTQMRRLALKKTFRPLGYPSIYFSTAEDPYDQIAEMSTLVSKYAGIVVLNNPESWQALALVTMRLNVYTDPQKPIQVEAKYYPIGEPSDDAPVMLTTNFSLTYFTVESEVEASRVGSYILVVDTEGMSVLTAFAADKLTAEGVAKFLKASGIEDKVKHRKLIIPGYVAVMSGALQEESGWEIMVGPREASAIPAYLKTIWKAA